MRLSKLLIPALLVAGLLSNSDEANAQTPYVISHANGTWTPITGGTTYTPMEVNPGDGFGPWDEGFASIPLPFGFTFFGNTYNTIYFYTNGFFSFDSPPMGGPSILGPPFVVPSPMNPIHNFIGVAWDDLDSPNMTAEIRAETLGSAPNRTFVVQVTGMQEFFNANSNVDFQLQLVEGTSQFDVVYGPNNSIAQSTSAIEDATGAEGFNLFAAVTGCGVGCTCTPGNCGSPNWQPSGKTVTVELPNDPELSATLQAPPGAFPGTNFDVDIQLRNLGLRTPAPTSSSSGSRRPTRASQTRICSGRTPRTTTRRPPPSIGRRP